MLEKQKYQLINWSPFDESKSDYQYSIGRNFYEVVKSNYTEEASLRVYRIISYSDDYLWGQFTLDGSIKLFDLNDKKTDNCFMSLREAQQYAAGL